MLSKVCNREDLYAITHARFNTLKSTCDAIIYGVGINFCRKAVTMNEEEGFFKISENKFPSKITCYM